MKSSNTQHFVQGRRTLVFKKLFQIFNPKYIQFFQKWRRSEFVLLFLILAALFLRLYYIDQQCLWSDECASLGGARRASIIDVLFHSSRFHPPLYYFFLHFWSELGLDEFTLRLPSAVFGTLLVPVLYLLGRELGDEKTGLVAAFMGTFNPFLVWYSQEVRMYALFLLFAGLNILFFLYILHKNNRLYWLFFIVTLVSCLLTHFSAVFLIIIESLFLLGTRHKYRRCFYRLLWIYALSGVLVILVLSRYVQTILAEQAYGLFQGQVVWGRIFALPYSFFAFSAGYSAGPSLQKLHDINAVLILKQYGIVVIPYFIYFMVIFLLGIRVLRHHKENLMFLLLLLLLPLLLVYGLANFSLIHTFNVRYSCAAILAYIVINSFGVLKIKDKSVFILLIGLLTLLNIFSLSNYYHNPEYYKPDMRSVAHYIERYERPGDVVLSDEPGLFKLYFKGESHVDLLWIDTSKESEREKFQYIQNRLQGKKRLWIIPNRLWAFDPRGDIMAFFDDLDQISEKQFVGVRAILYELPPG